VVLEFSLDCGNKFVLRYGYIPERPTEGARVSDIFPSLRAGNRIGTRRVLVGMILAALRALLV